MIVKCFLNFMLLNIFLLQMCNAKSNVSPTSGPYRSMVLSVEDCKIPTRPYIKDPPLIFQTSTNNSSGKILTLSGNFTVVRNTKNVKYKIKSFLWRDGKWESNYMINNIDCHGMLLHLISVATKVKFDRKNCMYSKGSYVFKDLDVNQMNHLMVSTMEYGRLMWRFEMVTPAGTIICKEYDTVVEPDQI